MNNYKELLTIVRDKYLEALKQPTDTLYGYLRDNYLLCGICYAINKYYNPYQGLEGGIIMWRIMKKHYISLYGDLPTRSHWWSTPLKSRRDMTTLIDKCITPRINFLNHLIMYHYFE